MGLVLARGLEESYFLYAEEDIPAGTCIAEIKKIGVTQRFDIGYVIRDWIDAPKNVKILREELIGKDISKDIGKEKEGLEGIEGIEGIIYGRE